MLVQNYLFFGGNCADAINFYKTAVDANVEHMMQYKDAPTDTKAHCPPDSADMVMHVAFKIGDSTVMASDDPSSKETKFHGFALSIGLKSKDDADRYFKNLSDGGKVIMPMSKTFWSPHFGMVTDKFGVQWMINVEHPNMKK